MNTIERQCKLWGGAALMVLAAYVLTVLWMI